MPSPDYSLTLSPKAEQDIENILRYTGEAWGEKQLLIYRDKLADALEMLRANPAIGHQTPPLPETHRLYPLGSHVIVYRTNEFVIGVIRILHQRMSVTRHL